MGEQLQAEGTQRPVKMDENFGLLGSERLSLRCHREGVAQEDAAVVDLHHKTQLTQMIYGYREEEEKGDIKGVR